MAKSLSSGGESLPLSAGTFFILSSLELSATQVYEP
jgi:hypothetical protein